MRINSPKLNIMYKACVKASKIYKDLRNRKFTGILKGPGDFVSSADKRTERILIEELQKAHPDYGIITEETGIINKNTTNRWIVDPIDGTMNLLMAFLNLLFL